LVVVWLFGSLVCWLFVWLFGSLVCWLVVWLFGSLVCWFVVWLLVSLVCWLVGWFGCLVRWFVGWLGVWFVGLLVRCLVVRFVGLLGVCLVVWFVGLLVVCLVVWFVGLLVVWFVGLLVVWFVGLLVGCLVVWFVGLLVGCLVVYLISCFIVRGAADKSLARPGRKQATTTKLRIYSTHSPRSSVHFLARCSNFWKPLKKKVRWRIFSNCFSLNGLNFLRRLALQEKILDDSSRLDVVEIARVAWRTYFQPL